MSIYVVRTTSVNNIKLEEGYRAVTEGIPKPYTEALSDARWGEPARKEWQTIIDSKAIVKVDN